MMPNSTISEGLKLGALLIAESASPLPLEHTQVNAHLNGLVATVTVRQRFSNPQSEPVELEYLFPLPQDAALVNFQIQIGQRLVRGDLREREQAEQAYTQAQLEGKHAALLDQKRPNLFSIRIANIRPGEAVETAINYEDRLTLQPGEMEFVFPMGLTPRYHSPQHPAGPEKVNPAYAHPGEKIGDVSIQLTATPGFATGVPTSPSHTLKLDQPTLGGFSLALEGHNIPDHDFVLRIPMTGQPLEVFARCGKDSAGTAALIDWLPGDGAGAHQTLTPREFVFVLDRSGSMGGEPIQQARNALRACLRILEPHDTFHILLFDDQLEWYLPAATHVSQAAIHQADQYLNAVSDRGGTEIIPALQAALGLPTDPERVRYILFLTDGAVSAEEQALAALRQQLGRSRIFTFGIGSSVNRALLTKMAAWGRGTAEFLQIDEDIEGAILRFQDKVAFPMLTDIALEWIDCQAWDIYPPLLPDLYVGQPLQLSARIKPTPQRTALLRISGRRGQEMVHLDIALPEPDPDFPEAARLWARARITDLLDQPSQAAPGRQVRQEVIGLALEHHLVTPYTAFVAVDSEVVNKKGKNSFLPVAHPQPRGLSQDLFSGPPPMAAFAAQPLPVLPQPSSPPPSSMNVYASGVEYEEDASLPQKFFLRGSSRKTKSMAAPVPSGPPPFSGVRENRDALESSQLPITPDAILRELVRSQELDGSWQQNIELTAAALLALLRNGHSLRAGYYRKQVRRAADWLAKAPAGGPAGAAQALALAELGQIDPDMQWSQAARQIIAQVDPAASAFDQAVVAHILQTTVSPQTPTVLNTIDDLRLAVGLRQSYAQVPAWVSNHPDPLAKVWAAALMAKA